MRLLSPSFALASTMVLFGVVAACSDDEGGSSSSTTGSGAGGATSTTTAGATGGATTSSSVTSSTSTTSSTASSSTGSAGGGGSAEGGGGGSGCGPLPLLSEAPDTLSDTGLYDDIVSDVVAPYAKPFQPLYPLWTDGAEKQRWFYMPDCEQIDTTDMDAWQMPVGARLWKQFTRDGVRVETRMIMRTGPGISDFEFAAYQWQGAEAYRVQTGVIDANGTGHDIPEEALCSSCHRKDWRVLGFSAVQLTHSLPGETMASLSNAGLLTSPLPGGIVIPGTPTDQAALGYLHANCASCHYQGGVNNPAMHFKVLQAHTTVASTDTVTTAVNVMSTMFPCGCDRIEPGDPAASSVVQRMSVRGGGQMPPFATEVVDDAGVQAVSDWIAQLPP